MPPSSKSPLDNLQAEWELKWFSGNPSLVERFLKEKSTPSWVSGVTSNIDNPLLVASHMLPWLSWVILLMRLSHNPLFTSNQCSESFLSPRQSILVYGLTTIYLCRPWIQWKWRAAWMAVSLFDWHKSFRVSRHDVHYTESVCSPDIHFVSIVITDIEYIDIIPIR